MSDTGRFETDEEIASREAQEREDLISSLRTRGAPISEARQIIADCTDERGKLHERSLLNEISRICVERNRLARLTVGFKMWLKDAK